MSPYAPTLEQMDAAAARLADINKLQKLFSPVGFARCRVALALSDLADVAREAAQTPGMSRLYLEALNLLHEAIELFVARIAIDPLTEEPIDNAASTPTDVAG